MYHPKVRGGTLAIGCIVCTFDVELVESPSTVIQSTSPEQEDRAAMMNGEGGGVGGAVGRGGGKED